MLYQEFDPAVADAVQYLSDVVTDEQSRLQLQKVLGRPGTRLLAREGDAFLFRLQAIVRDEYPEYRFFVLGQLIELRRMSPSSDEYSFVDFPPLLEGRRQWVQDKFGEVSLTTEDGLGWFAPTRWEQLSEAQRVMCKPKFIKDNVQYFSM
jgi:hypothetical protein